MVREGGQRREAAKVKQFEGALVGTLGQGGVGTGTPEKKPIPGHSSAGGDRKELFCSLNDFLPFFLCLGWGSGLRSAAFMLGNDL